MITTNMAMQLNYQGLHLYLCCQSLKVSNLPMSKKELKKELKKKCSDAVKILLIIVSNLELCI